MTVEEGIKRSQIGEGEKGTSSGGQEKGVQGTTERKESSLEKTTQVIRKAPMKISSFSFFAVSKNVM